MKKLTAYLFFLTALTSSAQAAPRIYTGTDLMRWIESDERVTSGLAREEDFVNGIRLSAYVAAISDVMQLAPKICQPSGINVKQLVAIVAKEVRSSPEDWTAPASTFAVTAISKAFPCPSK